MPLENRIAVPEAPAPVQQEGTVFDGKTERQKEALKILEEGTRQVLTSEGYMQYLRMQGLFHKYSTNNVLLIMTQNPYATMVNSYDRWKQLNRQVRKGEKGIKIFYPMFQTVKDPATGEEKKALSGFGVGNVFDLSQTDGEPLPQRPPEPAVDTNWTDLSETLYKRMATWLDDEKVALHLKTLEPDTGGYYAPDTKQIVINQTTTLNQFDVAKVRILAHEASHYLADHRPDMDRTQAEAVAEGSAYSTLYHFGIDLGVVSYDYLAAWTKKPDVLRQHLGEIQKVSGTLISAIEKTPDPSNPDALSHVLLGSGGTQFPNGHA